MISRDHEHHGNGCDAQNVHDRPTIAVRLKVEQNQLIADVE
jgi:hypothetical protein